MTPCPRSSVSDRLPPWFVSALKHTHGKAFCPGGEQSLARATHSQLPPPPPTSDRCPVSYSGSMGMACAVAMKLRGSYHSSWFRRGRKVGRRRWRRRTCLSFRLQPARLPYSESPALGRLALGPGRALPFRQVSLLATPSSEGSHCFRLLLGDARPMVCTSSSPASPGMYLASARAQAVPRGARAPRAPPGRHWGALPRTGP